MTDDANGAGTPDDPWQLSTPPGTSSFEAYRDPQSEPPALVVQVYADVLAYILQVNGYPGGDKELPTDTGAQQAMSLKRD